MLISYILCVSLKVRKISQEEKTKRCGMIKLDSCVDQWLRVWTICVIGIKWLNLSGSQFSQLQAEIKNNNICLLRSLRILNVMSMFIACLPWYLDACKSLTSFSNFSLPLSKPEAQSNEIICLGHHTHPEGKVKQNSKCYKVHESCQDQRT